MFNLSNFKLISKNRMKYFCFHLLKHVILKELFNQRKTIIKDTIQSLFFKQLFYFIGKIR